MNKEALFLIRSDIFNSIFFLSKLYEIIKKLKNQYRQYGSKWLYKIYLRCRGERGYNAHRIGSILITRILKNNIYIFLSNVLLDIKFI